MYRWHSAFERDFDAGGHGVESRSSITVLVVFAPIHTYLTQKITLLPDGEKNTASVNTVAIATVKTKRNDYQLHLEHKT